MLEVDKQNIDPELADLVNSKPKKRKRVEKEVVML